MKIAVFGLGYVGVVTAACLASKGHAVIGVDIVKEKVDSINRAQSPVQEPGLSEILRGAVRSGNLKASLAGSSALALADIILVCVGTPSKKDGQVDLTAINHVRQQLNDASNYSRNKSIVVRSTVPPGTTRKIFGGLPRSAEKPEYSIVFHPEFLREGSAISDFFEPGLIVIGEEEAGAGAKLMELYSETLTAEMIICDLEAAEMVKYAANAFHATKITFANEIGILAKALSIDAQIVMKALCGDTRLNISPAYLRPGFAFGGSCLPKDLRALNHLERAHCLDLPLLRNLLISNLRQIEQMACRIAGLSRKEKVGFLGLTFKEGTDDFRESPFLQLATRVLELGCPIKILEPCLQLGRLSGQNKAYVERFLPELKRAVVTCLDELRDCRVLVRCHKGISPSDALSGPDQFIIDLTIG